MKKKTNKCFTCGEPCHNYKCEKCHHTKKGVPPSKLWRTKKMINHIPQQFEPFLPQRRTYSAAGETIQKGMTGKKYLKIIIMRNIRGIGLTVNALGLVLHLLGWKYA